MRPVYKSLNALGNTPMIPISYLQSTFNVTAAATISAGASLTYKLQQSYDEPEIMKRQVLLSQTTTVITVTDSGIDGLGHGLNVGDDVIIQGSQAGMDGEYNVVTVPSATTYTLTSATSQSATSSVGKVVTYRVFDNATMTGQTNKSAVSLNNPVTAVRLVTTIYASGVVTLAIVQGLGI